MGRREIEKEGKRGLSRRDFLKASAAIAAAGGLDMAFAKPAFGAIQEGMVENTHYTLKHTTCPYCSASCGQIVATATAAAGTYTNNVTGLPFAAGDIVDIWGDARSPINKGGLCAKGAGAFQLVTNKRRLGAFTGTHPVNPVFEADTTTYPDGVAYKRTGDADWTAMDLDTAMDEIALALTTSRGPVTGIDALLSVFTAGEAVNGVTYEGFSGLATVKKPDNSWMVTTNGTKVDPATLAALLADAVDAEGIAALLAAFDSLVFRAGDPVVKSSYTYVGLSNLGTTLATEGVLANTADIVLDGATYYVYAVNSINGEMHVATSPDMLTWTYGSNLGKPDAVTTMSSPSVLKTGASLKVWYVNETSSSSGVLQYASWDGSDWSAATNITVGGSEPIWFVGHPLVTSDGTNLTLQYAQGSGGVRKASAPVGTPAVFGAASAVYDDAAKSEGNICAGAKGIAFTSYTNPNPLGWAYADIKGFVLANGYNSKAVAFLGCSHMNNEQNYTYRKLIAQFGSSNTEHQARI